MLASLAEPTWQDEAVPTSTGSEQGPGAHVEADNFGVRCSGCGRTQPPDRQPTVMRWPYCVYCAAPLSMTRWVASPPAGLGPAPRIRRVEMPYLGPPRYGAVHPGWGFPPVAQLRDDIGDSNSVVGGSGAGNGGVDGSDNGIGNDSVGGNRVGSAAAREAARQLSEASLGHRLSAAISLTLATGVTCLASAAAEGWRFSLLLRGRTEVLPAKPVQASDAVVMVTSIAALVLAVLAVLASVAALSALYRASANHVNLRPARGPGAIAARLIVPVWNLYGAGQIIVEVVHLVFRPVDGIGRGTPRWMRRLVRVCWAAWVLNGAVVAAIAVFSFVPSLPWRLGKSDQFAVNLVEAHMTLNVLAAVTAILFAVTLAALRNEWFGGRPGRRSKWTVSAPVSTARNRQENISVSSSTADGACITADRVSSHVVGAVATGLHAASRVPASSDSPVSTGSRPSADSRTHSGQHRRRQ